MALECVCEATFHGGAADQLHFTLGRAPMFVRVVESQRGVLDVLDQLNDTIRDDEDIADVYRLGDHGFACARGGRGASGAFAAYHKHDASRSQMQELGDNQAWREWATREGSSQET